VRVQRIVRTATGASPDEVDGALEAADGDAKVAIVSLLAGVDAATARSRLQASGQRIREALEP
jgi:N-acetylmuramic acid 6-phosphate etherase